MRCPKCQTETRGAERLEANLVADHCRSCGGHWVSSFQYWRWRSTVASAMPASLPRADAKMAPGTDSNQAMICPECRHILGRHRVGRGLDFYLDHCGVCGGMWFDAEEWAILRRHQLHTDVHKIFTVVWQRERRSEEGRKAMASLYGQRFGEQEYARLREIRDWLEKQPERRAMLRYLSDRDPYAT